MNASEIANFIWAVADLLRGDYKQSEYGKVMCQFKPGHALNPEIIEKHGKVILRVVRQVKYSTNQNNDNSIDLVFFVNGIPVATWELKTDFTQSIDDAVKQYREDRPPRDPQTNKDEPLLKFKRGALVHFAVSTAEVEMTTRLAGKSTYFLPFNLGHDEGAGNPPNLNGYRVSYLWERVFERSALLDILGRFMHLSVEEKTDDKGKKYNVETMIFPRFHQWEAVTGLIEAAGNEGSGNRYLIQHSAGSVGDKIFLAFLEYAGTTLDDLKDVGRREALKATCEAASNEITEEIFQFWSQNNALEVVIDIDSGKAKDPAPFNTGTVAEIRIKNNNHKATLPLSERSAGFVWFFSFLAQFKQLKKTAGNANAIVLLDEPGLTLHGKAQGDLLRYIVERLLPDHQVIFTTHSPFMVPMDRLADVRIVEDVIIEKPGKRPEVKGTKVRSDVLEVGDDTLFPLQGALGYEVTQSLFIGANTWLVEGPSDILYLQVLSQALTKRRRVGIDPKWTLCPSGGIDKIAPFVRLFGGNRINVAVLSDIANGDKTKIENLKKAEILKAGHFYTCADFTGQAEADVEDLFDPELFVEMLNGAYKPPAANVVTTATLAAAAPTPRIVKKAEALFKLMPASVAEFDHFGAARWLLENPATLDADTPAINATLDRAEAVFKAFNELLD